MVCFVDMIIRAMLQRLVSAMEIDGRAAHVAWHLRPATLTQCRYHRRQTASGIVDVIHQQQPAFRLQPGDQNFQPVDLYRWRLFANARVGTCTYCAVVGDGAVEGKPFLNRHRHGCATPPQACQMRRAPTTGLNAARQLPGVTQQLCCAEIPLFHFGLSLRPVGAARRTMELSGHRRHTTHADHVGHSDAPCLARPVPNRSTRVAAIVQRASYGATAQARPVPRPYALRRQ